MTNSYSPQPPKTSANWPRSFLYRSKRAKPDKKGARSQFGAPLSAPATRRFSTEWAESVNSLQARDEIRTAARADIQTGAVRGLSLRCGGRFETCLLDAGFRINDCKPAKSTLADSPITLGNHPYFNRYRRATHRTKTIKRHSNRCLCGSHLRSELNRANLDRRWTSAPQCGALTHSTGFRATSPRR